MSVSVTFLYIFNYVIFLTIFGLIKVTADFEWAVKLNRFTLNFLGLWPKNVQNSWQKLMCNFRMLIVFLGITFCLFIPSIHSLITVYGDILMMLDNLQITIPVMSCLIRIIIFWCKKEAVIPIINMIMKDWKKIKNDQERNLMIRRAQTARIIIICSFCIMALQWICVSILPFFGMAMRLTSNITDPGRIPMPIQSRYIYDITKSPQYELTFISQAVYTIIAIMVYSGVDNFLSLVVFHISGQLDILANCMQHLDKLKNYPKVLKRCIQKHIRLLRAIDIIEDTYNKILLSLFIYFAIIFAFYGFRIISCNKVYYAAYSSKWYTMDPKVAKDLLLLMKRDSKQICLTVGKMSPVTMATFCSVRFIESIMNMIVKDWVKLKNAEEKSMMIRRARSARIIITFAYCIMGTGCFFLIVLPSFGISMRDLTNITDLGRPMPLQTHYIYDITKSPQYELIFISQSVYIIITMMFYSGIDNFLGLLVFHICGQLNIKPILQLRFMKNRLTSLDKCKNSHEILNSCITRHIRLLRFDPYEIHNQYFIYILYIYYLIYGLSFIVIDMIEDTYNIILLFLFVYFAILFAFYGFRIIIVSIF
ncbi:hypothetical protein ALC57_13104 [Trachymyrmex cornetzi]|uniref:Odorant receptor 13a n=1 Tax=Trachymyrmex cornetzi TaxID=471704 RepID=A0A195DP49_9HYME|nr:hypothetical protein ALC57_13104 [Trachymyrmex cornetzi]